MNNLPKTMKNFTLFLALAGTTGFLCPPASAQIVPDATLPVNSAVTPSGETLEITAGTRAGGNLFHSFKEFSVPTGTRAFFNNSPDIQNIITRVTGGSISNIDGSIRTNGTANLFLLNPSGIIFGPNAKLDIGGSFLGSSASAIKFADGSTYSATPSQTAPLLTVSVPAGLQWGTAANPIRVQGYNLAVPPAQTLALAGGDIAIEGGTLTAPAGRIELASVANGSLLMTVGSGQIALSNQDLATEFGDIQLSGQASVDASGERGGDIQVLGRRVTVAGGSRIASFTLGSQPGGNVSVSASESVEVIGTGEDFSLAVLLLKFAIRPLQPSDFPNGLLTGTFGTGAAGDVTIKTGSLSVRNGTLVTSLTAGSGAGGNLAVDAAGAVEILGTGTSSGRFDPANEVSIALPEVLNGLGSLTFGSGDGGSVTVNAGRLTVRDKAAVVAGTLGAGGGGNLTVNARDLVETYNGIIATGALNTGASGDLKIVTGELRLIRRGGILSGTIAQGNAGNLSIDAARVFMEGATIAASTTSSGQGGNITLNASESVEVTDRASVVSQTSGAGSAGNLTVTTPRLLVRGIRAGMSTATVGPGKGGDLTVNASQSVELTGISAEPFTVTEETIRAILASGTEFTKFSGLAAASSINSGDAGNLTINTPRLIIQNGAGATTATLGAGLGGKLTVNASEFVEIAGRGGLATATLGSKNAGDLIINTPRLTLRDGAAISADTFGAGNAGSLTINTRQMTVLSGSRTGVGTGNYSAGKGGNLTVRASESVELEGTSADGQVKSGLFGNTLGAGAAGDVRIETGLLTVGKGAEITVSGTNRGDAGNLEMRADFIRLDGGTVAATAAAGNRGNISLQTGAFQLRHNSSLTTNATGTATGGNITINTDTLAALENSDITANSVASAGGQVNIATQGIFLQGILGKEVRRDASPLASDITATSQLGPQFDGTVDIKTPEVDPTKGILSLPDNFVDVAGLIDRRCLTGTRESGNFIITGRGGKPPSPSEPLSSNAGWVDSSAPVAGEPKDLPPGSAPPVPRAGVLVEATRWVINAKGEVELVGESPVVTPHSSCAGGL
jgi:filamentous hemagglutinin family protein